MNKTYRILVVFFVFVGCEKDGGDVRQQTDALYADIIESMNMPRPEDSYNYPVFPGSDKWKSLNSLKEKERACQVPAKTLRKQSTQAVMQALWEYPLVNNFMAWDNRQDGFEFVFYPLDAYKELVKRPDAGSVLLYRYLLVEPKHAYWPVNYVLGILLAQSEFMDQLTLAEKRESVRRGLEICVVRLDNALYADYYTALCTTYFLGRMMRSASYAPFIELLVSHQDWQAFFDRYDIHQRFSTTPRGVIDFEEQIFALSAAFAGDQH